MALSDKVHFTKELCANVLYLVFPSPYTFLRALKLFLFDNLFTLDLWLCIPFRRVVHSSSSWIWYWKKLVQRPVLCLLAAALTNEEWSVWPFICAKANLSLFSVCLIPAPVLLQIWRMSLHYLFQWHLSYSMDWWLCPALDCAMWGSAEGCRRAVSHACLSLSLSVPSPAHSAGLEVTTEDNWEDDC